MLLYVYVQILIGSKKWCCPLNKRTVDETSIWYTNAVCSSCIDIGPSKTKCLIIISSNKCIHGAITISHRSNSQLNNQISFWDLQYFSNKIVSCIFKQHFQQNYIEKVFLKFSMQTKSCNTKLKFNFVAIYSLVNCITQLKKFQYSEQSRYDQTFCIYLRAN